MVQLEGIRRALFALTTAAILAACGRTGVLLPSWSSDSGDTTLSTGAVAGRAFAPAESRAGAGGVAPSASAGQAGMSGTAGSAGSSLGGAAGGQLGGASGAGGAAGAAPTLKACAPSLTPTIDGLLSTRMERDPALSVAGDWNRDGMLDLALANTDGSVSVLLGRGDGTFDPSISYASGQESQQASNGMSFAAGDLDGNGTLDLLIAPRYASRLSVLLGAGDGTFAPPVMSALGTAALELALGDFDGDGDADIAVAGDTGAVLLLNQGDGSLGGGVEISSNHDQIESIAAGDLNQDGRLDLVTLSATELTVLIGDGRGRFVPTQVLPGSIYDDPVRIADTNGDGRPDLLYPQSCGPPDGRPSTSVFLGRGNGTFADESRTAAKSSCDWRAQIADVNGDGAADVLMSAPFSVQFGSPNGLRDSVRTGNASGGNLLGTGDWNGDGKLDLATTREQWLSVHLGNGDGSFGSSPAYPAAFDPGSLALADLDLDGVLDVAASSDNWGLRGSNATALSVLRGSGEGAFLAHVDYPSTLGASHPVAADLNGDGWPDLLTSTYDSILVRLGTGNGTFGPEITWLVGEYIDTFAVADLNQDGHPDIVAAKNGPPELRLLLGAGDGAFAPIAPVRLPNDPSDVAVADVNGDAKPDLIAVLRESAMVDVLLGHADGTFAADQLYRTNGASGVTPADLNADGNVDLVTWSVDWNHDSISVFLGIGKGAFAPRLESPGKAYGLAAVDFNRDGHEDLVAIDSSGIKLLLGAGDGTFICEARYVGDPMYDLGVGDLNRDGRLDLVTTTGAGVNVFLNSTP